MISLGSDWMELSVKASHLGRSDLCLASCLLQLRWCELLGPSSIGILGRKWSLFGYKEGRWVRVHECMMR